MKNILEIEKYLEGLGLSWIMIAIALSDSNIERSKKILTENPQITKAQFLKKMEMVEDKD